MDASTLSVFEVSPLGQDECRQILVSSDLIPNEAVVSEMFPPDYRDLLRLAVIVRDRKPRSVLEFGSGQSSFVIAASMARLAFDNPESNFDFHTVEASKKYADQAQSLVETVTAPSNFEFSVCESSVILQEVTGRFATLYEFIPNVRPDFVYLDGPSPADCSGSIRGFSANDQLRMPMAADLIFLEYFFEPGAVILVDGRTANARFLRDAFLQDWWHHHDTLGDVHYFELAEAPLGQRNSRSMVERFEGKLLRDSLPNLAPTNEVLS